MGKDMKNPTVKQRQVAPQDRVDAQASVRAPGIDRPGREAKGRKRDQAGAGKKAMSAKTAKAFPIVGMGASAGGLEAFEGFFSHMPAENGIAFILVPHLDPSHPSMMTELLKRYTRMEVVEVKDGMKITPNKVYIIPPNKEMALKEGIPRLTEPREPRGMRMPIDSFFRSLAEDQGERSICIILSGTGSDGTIGLRAIHGAGGMTMIQDPSTAKYEGMPRNAVATGVVDYVLPVEKMPEQLVSFVHHGYPERVKKVADMAEKSPKTLERLFAILRKQTGHDFSLYKKSTIYRRIERRMALHDIKGIHAYVEYLEGNHEEINLLFKELLIRVTSFFRDKESFDVLKDVILPELLGDKDEGYQFRVWVPGCASGEEVYSIAMVLREYMDGVGKDYKFQIFGTDIDEDAINDARTGNYPANIAIDVNPERLKRFFVKEDSFFRIKKEIRE